MRNIAIGTQAIKHNMAVLYLYAHSLYGIVVQLGHKIRRQICYFAAFLAYHVVMIVEVAIVPVRTLAHFYFMCHAACGKTV